MKNMKKVELIDALLRINEPCDVFFKDRNNEFISKVLWEDITNIKTALYHEMVEVVKLNSLSEKGRKQIRIKFLEDGWRTKK